MWHLIAFYLCSLIILLIYFLSKRKFDYWKKRKVPYLEPKPILGNYGDYLLLRETIGSVAQKICQKFPEEPVVGAFYGTEPTLIIQDPQLIKQVMTKDFYYFNGREVSDHVHKEVVTQSIFFTYGEQWRVLRQNLTPLFSSAKMKSMFYLIEKCAKEFENVLDVETSKTDVVEVWSLGARYLMDCIGSCVFGIETKALENVKENQFWYYGSKVFEISAKRAIALNLRAIWPSLFYGLGFKTFSIEVDNFFSKLLTSIFERRNDNLDVKRQDFIDLLLEFKKNKYIYGDKIDNLKNQSQEKAKLEANDELLISHSTAFFAAGYETSAATLASTLFELAKNAEAQELVLNKIDGYLKVKRNKLGYDCINELPYLDQCISEAQRLYPVLTVITREVYEDYTLPNGLHLERGLRVHLPVQHLHMNPKYFPDPDKYIPERFSPENKNNITPYTYMPFGEGARVCIGKRFAKMQVIAGLITVLKKYRVELADGMPTKLTADPRGLVTKFTGDMMLKLVSREGWENRIFA